MSDELDDLKQALTAATPRPDAARRAATLRAAERAFEKNPDAGQGSAAPARPTFVRPHRGLFKGVKDMLARYPLRGALAGTTALAAVALVTLTPVLRNNPADFPQIVPESATIRQEIAPEPASDPAAPPQVMADIAAPADAMAPQALAREKLGQRGLMMPRAADAPGLPVFEADTEAYPDADANPLKITAEDPVSTFSVDVDTASYANIRRFLNAGQLPPHAAVRIEEMVNYFPYAYPAPQDGAAFATTVHVTDTPWNPGTRLVHIGLQGAPVTERPPLNLVFLIDTSGSMDQPDKLPLLKQAFRLLLGQLLPQDQVAIVTYAGSAGQVLAPTSVSDRRAILAALDQLGAGGNTAGQAGLEQAYAVAEGMTAEGEVSRVILATDGDFNVGLFDPEGLKRFVAQKRDSGTYLNVLGFGRGNLDDATLQALAQNGNGQAAYIDSLAEAQKSLVDQLQGALFPIAQDVKVQVEFNPATVAEYRLIGYETRALRREDFNNDRVDAGEIGAGHQVTAIYEITPVGSDARLTDPLRYGAGQVAGDSTELGLLRLRHKAPGGTDSALSETVIPVQTGPLPDDARFAIAIAGFGQLLTDSPYLGDWGWDQAVTLATEARGQDPFGYRQEAIGLMRLAAALSQAR